MGKFIDEVSKINQNNNHKLRISEERQNVKNTLYKRFYREFRNCDNIDDAYNRLVNLRTKTQICYSEYDFGNHVTMEFIETTYYKELKKVYKIFQEYLAIEKKTDEKHEVSPLMIIFDEKGKMLLSKTFENHAKNNIPCFIETIGDNNVNHYKILDRDGKIYDFKIYYFKNNGALNVMQTQYELRKDGLLDGIPIKSSLSANILIAIPVILLLAYLGFYALIGLLVFLFIFLIIILG